MSLGLILNTKRSNHEQDKILREVQDIHAEGHVQQVWKSDGPEGSA